ncbi:hypothetical protein COL72_28935 [Bacillus toyonensis]|uniref:hypothetical protein n=1 Tax=Bacillus toyonensis TaxID=155322 RepID=UPI000BF989AB|nr:hypothetical protein [Bacillus toyonensis]PFZ67178.1 hypothetical protein COL72_28935 [Bacillus toyonensis]
MNTVGFIVTWKDYSDSVSTASFTIKGTKIEFVPNNRSLSNEGSVADIHSAGLLFDNAAQYVVINVMGSASILSKEKVAEKLEILNKKKLNCKLSMLNEEDSFCRELLNNKLEETSIKIKCQIEIEESRIGICIRQRNLVRISN